LRSDGWPVNKKGVNVYSQRLFGMVFNDNDDIFNNTECDHIDMNKCCNRSINVRWIASKENMNNRGVCLDKIDRKHDKTDIIYFKKWIDHVVKVKFVNIKIKKSKNDEQEKKKKDKIKLMKNYIQLLNDALKNIQNDIYNRIEKELEEK
jgi:hypothetical protein